MRRAIHSLFLSILILLAGSCNTTPLTDAIDNLNLVIQLPDIDTELSVQIVDAATGELVERPVEITFGNDLGEDVIDMYSKPVTEFSTRTGFMNVGLKNGSTFSAESPGKLDLILSAEGYRTQRSTIEVTSDGLSFHAVKMMSTVDPPAGVTVQTETIGNAIVGGELMQALNLSVSETSGPVESPSGGIEIPAGMMLLDKNENPLSGQLKTDMTIFNTMTPEVLSLINPAFLATDDGSAKIILGFFEVRITDQNGREAAYIKPSPAKVWKQSGASAAYEPLFNTIFNNAIWWIGTPNPNPPPSTAIYEFSPLSDLPGLTQPFFGWMDTFNFEACVLGLSVGPYGTYTTSCSMNGPYIGDGSSFPGQNVLSQTTEAVDLQVEIVRNGHSGNVTLTLTGANGYNDTKILNDATTATFSGTPKAVSDLDYVLTISIAGLSGEPITQSITASEHASGRFTYQLPAPPPSLINATLKVTLACSDPTEKPSISDIPTASFYYRPSGTSQNNPWIASDITFEFDSSIPALTGGTALLSGVEVGRSYDMKLVYDNEVEERTITVTGPQVGYTETLDDDVCR